MQDCEVQIPTTPGERLISTRTDDGLDLDGILIGSDRPRGQPLLLWIHGFGANFYFAPYLRLARAIAAHGVASAIVNTRGHDLATLLQPERGVPYWGGGAWEKLDDAPRDLAAWLTLATDVGFSQIALAGHSLGAVKATHYLAERQDARVLGLALTSPPLRPSWDTRAYPAALAEAERLVRAGQPEALIDGPWGPVSAQTYLTLDRVSFDQFGRAGLAPNVARIRCPILAVIGSEDSQVCTAGDLDMLRRNATAAVRVETHIIDGSDHFFNGHVAETGELLAKWVTTLGQTPAAPDKTPQSAR